MMHSAPAERTLWITLACLLAATPAAAQSRLAIMPVTVVDVTDGSLQADRTVLVEGDRIAAVGPAGEVEVPEGTTIVDGTGGYLIPGLWDMHTHHAWDSFELYIANGVTGVRDVGNARRPWTELHALRRAIEAREIVGPRFYAAGPTLLGTQNPVREEPRTRQEARAIVDSLGEEGADFIKIYTWLPRDVYFAVADQARRRGIAIMGHLPDEVTIEEAIGAGHRSAEHISGWPHHLVARCTWPEWERTREELNALRGAVPPDSLRRRFVARMRAAGEQYDHERCRGELRRLAARDLWVTPTLLLVDYQLAAPPEGILERPEIRYVPPNVRERWREMERRNRTDPLMLDRTGEIDLFYRIVGELQDAGVGLLAGSDTDLTSIPFVVPGFGLHDELIALVDAGLTPLEALQTATLNPAKFFGRNDELGTVEPGKLADLVLLNANPLEDIRNTQRIGAVVAGGRLYRRSGLDRLLAEVEASVQRGQQQE